MNPGSLLDTADVLASPALFALLVGFAVILIWESFAPARPAEQVKERMEGYLDRVDITEESEISRPLAVRAIFSPLKGLLRRLGGLLPKRMVASTERQLVMAGSPMGFSALDYMGLCLLMVIPFAFGYFLFFGRSQPLAIALRNTLALALLGYLLPVYWLRRRVRQRKHDIVRALPDALDMMTIGVEAGLAFESAMLRVGDRWDNALTREFRRTVAEMRMGTPRNEALQRMVERTGVLDLNTFVAVLIQSSQLGVSVAEVLHAQADQMRVKRRQRAEERGRQAGIKMIFPLALCILPATMIVILGPTIPIFIEMFATLSGGR
jgi:tight adherence protein C